MMKPEAQPVENVASMKKTTGNHSYCDSVTEDSRQEMY
jgi:hypothetical protein